MKYLKPVEIESDVSNQYEVIDELSLVVSDDISQVKTRFMPTGMTQKQPTPTPSIPKRPTTIPSTGRRIIIFSGEPLKIILDAVKSSYGDATLMDRKMVSLNEVIDAIAETQHSSFLSPFSLISKMHQDLKEMGITPVYSGYINKHTFFVPFSDTDEKYGAVSEDIISEADEKNMSVFLIIDNMPHVTPIFISEIAKSILSDLGFKVTDDMTLGSMLNTISNEVSQILQRIERIKTKAGRMKERLRKSSTGTKTIPLSLLKKFLEKYEQELEMESNIQNEVSNVSASVKYRTYYSVMLNQKIDTFPSVISSDKYKMTILKYSGKAVGGQNEAYIYRVSKLVFNDKDLEQKFNETSKQAKDLADTFGCGVLNLSLGNNIVLIISVCCI